MPDPGFGAVGQFYSISTNQGVIVVSGERISEPAYFTGYWTTWSTNDGLNWHMSDGWSSARNKHYNWIHIVAHGDGFVALANVDDLGGTQQQTDVFLSSDGDHWTQASVLDGTQIRSVASVDGNLIAAGLDATYSGALWLSSDASNWRLSTEPVSSKATLRSRLVSFGHRAAFFTPVDSHSSKVVEIWVSDDSGQSWNKATVPSIPAAADSNALGMLEGTLAAGPAGWIAAGWYDGDRPGEFAWWSRDGALWQNSDSMPHDVETIVGYSQGFIAGGYHSSEPCCATSGAGRGVTWFSANGLDWQLISEGWKNQDLQLLATTNDRVIGLTVDPASEGALPGGLWLANFGAFKR